MKLKTGIDVTERIHVKDRDDARGKLIGSVLRRRLPPSAAETAGPAPMTRSASRTWARSSWLIAARSTVLLPSVVHDDPGSPAMLSSLRIPPITIS